MSLFPSRPLPFSAPRQFPILRVREVKTVFCSQRQPTHQCIGVHHRVVNWEGTWLATQYTPIVVHLHLMIYPKVQTLLGVGIVIYPRQEISVLVYLRIWTSEVDTGSL